MRHGETFWNADRNRYCGRSDIPLSPNGERQAQEAARRLQSSGVAFSAVYSSPLRRARQTAGPLAASERLPVREDRRLIEIDFGEWDGVTAAEIREKHAAGWLAWTTDPGRTAAGRTGETALSVYERALGFFEEKSRLHPDDTVAVVAHDTWIRIFVAGMLEMPFRSYRRLRQQNAAVTVIETSEDGYVLKHLNDSLHGWRSETP
nr:histidine phosphatase family protein [Cohnella zeiphila]